MTKPKTRQLTFGDHRGSRIIMTVTRRWWLWQVVLNTVAILTMLSALAAMRDGDYAKAAAWQATAAVLWLMAVADRLETLIVGALACIAEEIREDR